jgi:RNA polymerase sigma factor (sigma-70 family)
MTRAIKDIRQLVEAPDAGDLTDRQLLERFAARHDEAAFALLVRRHGPMVLRVCRRILGHWHDAEDAFQAAFLILARKAASVRWQDSAAGWLFRVAYRLALKRRADARRRRTQPLPDVAVTGCAEAPDRELRSILEEELNRLPEKYRLALLLCHCEGKTRAEAARQLGWKEGAVKIRLERGRALLRARLTRRGLASTALPAGALAAVPPALADATVAAARWFALGKLPAAAAASRPAAALAEGVLRAMMITRLKIAALLLLAVSVASLGVGLWAHRALADRPPPQEVARQPQPGTPAPAKEPAPAGAPKKPLRVLLFAGGPTREYQFVRALFANQVERKEAELSICLQTGAARAVQGVPLQRLLERFPDRSGEDKEDNGGKKYDNLAMYDVLIAFDPDWMQLTEEQGGLLEQWVGKEGHGLILVAGPVNTLGLARPGAVGKLTKPIRDLLPVRLQDLRILDERPTDRPWPLGFPNLRGDALELTEKVLKLDPGGKDPVAGWAEFFFDRQREDWLTTEDPPWRGFYSAYPVESVKPGAVVLATFRDPRARIEEGGKPRDLPYLVLTSYGKGQTVYLGSGETWRLRQFRAGYHERFWAQLARYAATAGPAQAGDVDARIPPITPEQRKAIDKGLEWLAREQHRDGHWEEEGGKHPVAMTGLAGMALLMQGSTLTEGPYAQHIRKAVDWLLVRSQDGGRLGGRNSDDEGPQGIFGHGHALLFLASVYGEEEDADRRKRLKDVLTRAGELTAKAQTRGGGWGHVVGGLVNEGDDKAEVVPTVLQLQALRAARHAGIPVPKETFAKAWTYLEKNIDPRAPAGAAGMAGALALGAYETPAARKWLRQARESAPTFDPKGKRRALEDLNLYYFAQVAYFLGDAGHARLLPESKPGERITWSRYRKQAFDLLLKTQQADGSWKSEIGKVHAAALYLAILQLDNGAVPIYQR